MKDREWFRITVNTFICLAVLILILFGFLNFWKKGLYQRTVALQQNAETAHLSFSERQAQVLADECVTIESYELNGISVHNYVSKWVSVEGVNITDGFVSVHLNVTGYEYVSYVATFTAVTDKRDSLIVSEFTVSNNSKPKILTSPDRISDGSKLTLTIKPEGFVYDTRDAEVLAVSEDMIYMRLQRKSAADKYLQPILYYYGDKGLEDMYLPRVSDSIGNESYIAFSYDNTKELRLGIADSYGCVEEGVIMFWRTEDDVNVFITTPYYAYEELFYVNEKPVQITHRGDLGYSIITLSGDVGLVKIRGNEYRENIFRTAPYEIPIAGVDLLSGHAMVAD